VCICECVFWCVCVCVCGCVFMWVFVCYFVCLWLGLFVCCCVYVCVRVWLCTCEWVCVCVGEVVSDLVCVYFFNYILLLLSQHAPLHCVILHARFFLIEHLPLDICSLIHVLLQFFEVYRVSKVCKLFNL